MSICHNADPGDLCALSSALSFPLYLLQTKSNTSDRPKKILLQKHRTRSDAGVLNLVVTASELCVHNGARSPCFRRGEGGRSAFFRFLNTPAPAKKRKKTGTRRSSATAVFCFRYARASARSLTQDKQSRERQCPASEGAGQNPPERQKDTRACVRELTRSRARLPRVYNGPADHWNHPPALELPAMRVE